MRTLIAVLALATVAPALAAQSPAPEAAADAETWLPAHVVEGAAEHLSRQLLEAGYGVGDDAGRKAGALRFVSALRQEIETLGAEGVIALAPELHAFGVPSSGDRHLDAMARYQLCNLALTLELRDPERQKDATARTNAKLAMMATTLAVVRLRHPFLGQGGSDAAIEAFLTSAEMEPVFERVQGEPGLLGELEASCRPALSRLLTEPRRRLAAVPR